MKQFFVIASFIFLSTSAVRAEETIRGSVFPLPGGIIDTADSGLFIDVLNEIEACLPLGIKVTRRIYPPARAYANILGDNPSSDFAFPAIANPRSGEIEDPFLYTKSMGKVSFVIYSNESKPLTREDLLAGTQQKNYPYSIETFPNVSSYFPFPSKGFTCVECALRKVSAGRLDAYIMAMDDVDEVIRKEKMPSIHRELFADFDAVIAVGKGPRGQQVKKILDAATDCALKKGKLQPAYLKVHKPFK